MHVRYSHAFPGEGDEFAAFNSHADDDIFRDDGIDGGGDSDEEYLHGRAQATGDIAGDVDESSEVRVVVPPVNDSRLTCVGASCRTCLTKATIMIRWMTANSSTARTAARTMTLAMKTAPTQTMIFSFINKLLRLTCLDCVLYSRARRDYWTSQYFRSSGIALDRHSAGFALFTGGRDPIDVTERNVGDVGVGKPKVDPVLWHPSLRPISKDP